ncbi:hypothetical protein C8R43DRAFT_1209027 [Mycena crocata]|nr:hypothetical protein C8R43DRAFT_1209027 [Mycena crocata]
MPHQPKVNDIQLNTLLTCLKPAVALLDELNDTFGTPFLPALSKTMMSLIDANVRWNRIECLKLMEDTHGLLCAIVDLHIKSEPAGTIPPATLNHMGNFLETLRKTHTFMEAQHETHKIKQFFRQSDLKILLKDCHAGLQRARMEFKVDTSPFTCLGCILHEGQMDSNSMIFKGINEMTKRTENLHKELLDVISSLADNTLSMRSSVKMMSQRASCSDFGMSSTSFCMLPARPQIFHGRESELNQIVQIMIGGSGRIAILGGGGMGKTSLAKTALHHPDIAAKYEQRFFVAAESATTAVEVAAQIAQHIGINAAGNPTKFVVQQLSIYPSSLLILDNLEPSWEPQSSRNDVEVLLSLLADIPQLALIVGVSHL